MENESKPLDVGAKDQALMDNRILTVSERFQIELNALLEKYPTIKLSVTQSITISEKS